MTGQSVTCRVGLFPVVNAGAALGGVLPPPILRSKQNHHQTELRNSESGSSAGKGLAVFSRHHAPL